MILNGTEKHLQALQTRLAAIPVDETRRAPADFQEDRLETTLARPFEVTGPATYARKTTRTLRFLPAPAGTGWRIERTDLPEQLPITVAPQHVYASNRNIELRSGFPANALRLTEHIIAQRIGMGLDNVVIQTDSDDPPLFDFGSLPIAEGIRNAGLVPCGQTPVAYMTPAEPTALIGPDGNSFLLFEPAKNGSRRLSLDVAIDFPNAIGKQRIALDITPEIFLHGCQARTNCTLPQYLLIKTLGWFTRRARYFGYTDRNILVARKRGYHNEPRMLHDGKSLEAAWHRACEDLLAAVSLLERGRLCGTITSYRAGHTLDCRFMTLLVKHGLLCPHEQP